MITKHSSGQAAVLPWEMPHQKSKKWQIMLPEANEEEGIVQALEYLKLL